MLRINTTRNRSNTPHLIAYLITCIVLLIPISAFPFPTWVYVDPAMPEGSPPQIEITDHCDDYTKVKVTIPGFWCEDIYEAGHTFQRIWVPMYGTKMEDGKPELPVVRGLLGIPGTNNATDVEVLSATWEQFSDYLVYPHQPDHLISEPPPAFEWDEEFYQQNLWYPGDEALLSNQGMFREIKVVNNHIQCFQYNPAREFLKVASEMEIRVSYGASEGGSGGLQLEGETINRVHEDFMPLYKALLWNCNELNLVKDIPGFDYLIITGDVYYPVLEELVVHLDDRGYKVDMVSINSVSPTGNAKEVYQYIQSRYENDGIAYVLLVGDVPDKVGYGNIFEPFNPGFMVPIPYWYPDDQGYDGYPLYVNPSDVCYACLDVHQFPLRPPTGYEDPLWNAWWENYDMYPDVYVGRFTADTIFQTLVQVWKTIYYEDALEEPSKDNHPWYDQMVFVAYSGGLSKKDIIIDPENPVYGEPPYEIELPPVTLLWGDASTGHSNDTVMDKIEEGCFIVNYWGHGDWGKWAHWTDTLDSYPPPGPYDSFIKNVHVKDLENEYLPVVFNIGCSTASLDHNKQESDGGDTLCDFWLREHEYDPNAYTKAVAAIGATKVTWGENKEYDKMLFRMMYRPYAVPGPLKSLTEPMNILGAVHYGALTSTTAKLGLSNKDALRKLYCYIIQGDPSLEIRNIYTEEGRLKIKKPETLVEKHPVKLTVYPNPTSGIFTLNIQGYTPALSEIKVYDISGRLVSKIEIPEQNETLGSLTTGLTETELQIDLSALSDGLYILTVGEEAQERFLILK